MRFAVIRILCILGLSGIAFGASAIAQPLPYYLTDLGDLPGGSDHSEALGINASGHVVGFSMTQTGQRAFRWSAARGMQDLGAPSQVGDHSFAHDINSDGYIVGRAQILSQSGNIGPHALLWAPGGEMLDLGVFQGGENFSEAFAINDRVHVAGYGITTIGRAFVWTSDRGMWDLGGLPRGTGGSIANGINSADQVIGTAYSNLGARAFLWTEQDGMRELGDLLFPHGFSQSYAYGINDNGVVVGASSNLEGMRGFLWTNDGGMRALSAFPGEQSYAEARAINGSGQIIGRGSAANDLPILWTTDGQIWNLNDLLDEASRPWRVLEVQDINDAGQIVGVARTPSGVKHAILLTPVPEPKTIVFAALGLGLISLWLARRRLMHESGARLLE